MAECAACNGIGKVRSERGVWDRCPTCRLAWKPGDLCVLGGSRSTFKIGYVVGPSRSVGKWTVKSFSANKQRFSNAFAILDAHVLPLPSHASRKKCHARTIRLAVITSALERARLRKVK